MATEKVTPKQFLALMEELREAYPSMRETGPKWLGLVRRYYYGVGEIQGLGQYSQAVLAKALGEAPKQAPRFFPALGQLHPICQLEQANQQRRQTVGDPGPASEPTHPELEPDNPVSRVVAQLESEGPAKDAEEQKRRIRLLCRAVGAL